MSNIVQTNKIEAALIQGDLSKLSPEERLSYYKNVCESVGLNPLTKPFEYMRLGGREVLYANKGCAEQLRSIHKISLKIVGKEKIEDVYIVTAEAADKDGRIDSATGAVSVAGLKGEALANAMMKAETKSKRRVTLSLCGLNMLDESEVETIPGAVTGSKQPPKEIQAVPVQSPFKPLDNPGEYVVTFGKLKNKKLKDIDVLELTSYMDYIYNSAKTKGEEIKGQILEFINASNKYIDHKLPNKPDPAMDPADDLDAFLR